ncbi:MAG: rRNA maturation RNase YbeY [Atopobiaceae bacterium]|nr:rRNA maturation RNase YbeY [Atopobiaceae bacterium]
MLTIDLCNDEDVETPITEDEMRDICEMVLEQEGVGRPCYLSLSLVSDATIRTYNEQWRGVDAATDVISLECERPDDPDLAEGEPCELGDIMLAPAFIAAQAGRYATTVADEFRLLLIHGMLHLLGYDHVEDAEAEVMEAREDELLRLVATDAPMSHVTLTRHTEDDDA